MKHAAHDHDLNDYFTGCLITCDKAEIEGILITISNYDNSSLWLYPSKASQKKSWRLYIGITLSVHVPCKANFS